MPTPPSAKTARLVYNQLKSRVWALPSGPAAFLAAEVGTRQCVRLQAAWKAWLHREPVAATNEALDALEDELDQIMRAILFTAGYCQVDRPVEAQFLCQTITLSSPRSLP